MRLGGVLARLGNFSIGVWLAVSSTLWSQTGAARLDFAISGCVIALVALAGLWLNNVRFVNSLAALWLAFSVNLMGLSGAPYWSGTAAALLVFGLSLFPTRGALR